MNIEILNLIYFSPTGTTKRTIREMAKAFAIESVNEYNITKPGKTGHKIGNNKKSLTIIGTPVYGGRLPVEAVNRLKKFQSGNTPAVVLVVYGNRAYEDALLELKDLAARCGFKVIAAGAFIGEHSFSTKSRPIAEGRPDEKDLLKIKEFGQLIKDKIRNPYSIDSFGEPDVPGNYPYKECPPSHLSSMETIDENCNMCRICEDVCPVNAITINDKVITDNESCIKCCACVKSCPQNARIFNNPMMDKMFEEKYPVFRERKEPEFFV